jgi:hypothetical protein
MGSALGMAATMPPPRRFGNLVTWGLRGFFRTVSGKEKKLLFSSGWGTWIRTRTNGVRVRGSTVNLFPNPFVFSNLGGAEVAHIFVSVRQFTFRYVPALPLLVRTPAAAAF